MPNTKEKGKLIEVLSKHIPYGHATLCLIAEELMAEGVTVQEWIPSYNYPKETGFYNCYYKTPDSNLWRVGMCYWNDTNWIQVGFMPVAVQVMFWMPLPQPPKGE